MGIWHMIRTLKSRIKSTCQKLFAENSKDGNCSSEILIFDINQCLARGRKCLERMVGWEYKLTSKRHHADDGYLKARAEEQCMHYH